MALLKIASSWISLSRLGTEVFDLIACRGGISTDEEHFLLVWLHAVNSITQNLEQPFPGLECCAAREFESATSIELRCGNLTDP